MDLKQGALNYRAPVDLSALQSQIDTLAANGQAARADYIPTEGQTITPPTTTHNLMLVDLAPATVLNKVTVVLPSAAVSMDGQRVFIRSSRAIAELDVTSPDCTVDNWIVTFNPGDSVVYIKSKSTIWSRVT